MGKFHKFFMQHDFLRKISSAATCKNFSEDEKTLQENVCSMDQKSFSGILCGQKTGLWVLMYNFAFVKHSKNQAKQSITYEISYIISHVVLMYKCYPKFANCVHVCLRFSPYCS